MLIDQRRQWHPTPVLLPGKSHGRRSLVGQESDTTKWLHFHFSLSCIGEGNGNPLQCSGLENPRDGGAWWAAIYEVTQSQTRLKWLSSMKAWGQWPQSSGTMTMTWLPIHISTSKRTTSTCTFRNIMPRRKLHVSVNLFLIYIFVDAFLFFKANW